MDELSGVADTSVVLSGGGLHDDAKELFERLCALCKSTCGLLVRRATIQYRSGCSVWGTSFPQAFSHVP